MFSKPYLLVLMLLLSLGSQAQTLIKGNIIDQNTRQALPGVHIQEAHTGGGTISGSQGDFELQVSTADAAVTFSFIGYTAKTLPAGSIPALVSLEESVQELQQVVVSSSRQEQLRTETPVAISRLSPKEISEARASSLDQLANKVAGVYMVNLGNEQHSMSIRQPLSLKSLFLYLEDGVPIRPTGVFNHNALIEINGAATQSMEVVKGPASSIYGSEAIGGSVNFITQGASLYPTARLALMADNLGYKRTELALGGTLGNVGVQLSGYYANRRGGYREHNNFDKLALSLRTDWAIGTNSRLSSTASLIDYKADMSGSIDSSMFYTRQFPSLHTFTYRMVKALRIQSALDHQWSKTGKSTLTAFYRNNLIGQNPAYRVRNNRQDPAQATGEINENSFQSWGFIAQHHQELGFKDAFLIGGLSLDWSPTDYAAEFIRISRDTENGKYWGYTAADSLLARYRVGLLNRAAYAQFSISPLTELRLVMAARYDHFRYDYNNYLTPDAFSGAPDSKDYFSNISPKLGFTYELRKSTGLYGNWSIGFVPPQVTELYRGVKVPSLEPSRFNNWELGSWWRFGEGRGFLEASLYRLEGRNEVISVLLDDGTTENRNAGQTLHQGIEYTLRYAPAELLSLRFSGTNARHRFIHHQEGGASYDGKEMTAAPPWIANAEAFYYPRFLKGARLGVEWQHLGPYYMDLANTTRYEGFDVLNLRMGYAWGGLDLWLNVLNAGNALYATSAASSAWGKTYNPGDPRSFTLGLSYTFTKLP